MTNQFGTFIQFCEPSYVRSSFMAETWNTLSSFLYCLPAIYFWMLVNRHQKALPDCFPSGVVWRYKLCAMCWFVLGLGSAAFHAIQTLWAEMWDEIGMLLSILSISYCLFDLHPLTTSKRANWFYGALLSFVAATLAIYIQIMYHPFFATMFILAAIVPAVLVITLPMNVNKGATKLYHESTLAPKRAVVAARELVHKKSASLSPFGRLTMNHGVLLGILSCVVGYAIWHIDQKCVTGGWTPTDLNMYELDWFYWSHPFWHLATALGSIFFFDSMLKARVESFTSPLMRRARTGSFLSVFPFQKSVGLFLGMKGPVQTS